MWYFYKKNTFADEYKVKIAINNCMLGFNCRFQEKINSENREKTQSILDDLKDHLFHGTTLSLGYCTLYVYDVKIEKNC